MAKVWRMIRVPSELAARLDRLARHFEKAHSLGRLSLPNQYVERCPHHHVIATALNALEAHRARARQPRAARRSNVATPESARPRKGMYT
jgi:hypothetical protein